MSRKGEIRLSPAYGVNPAIPRCFYCLEDKNEVILAGMMFGSGSREIKAPQGKVWDKIPCDKCQDYMKQGIILISVDEAKSKDDLDNPWRTGGWVVVSEDFVKRELRPQEFVDGLLKKRAAFVPDAAWDMLGLPRGDEAKEPTT